MHERVRELVQKAYADSRTVALRDLRNQWLAHVSQEKPTFARTENDANRLDSAVIHVINVAEEIAVTVAGALGKRVSGVDEYFEDCERIWKGNRPENAYEW